MILGCDIGGVNTKVARLDPDGALIVRARPFELQRDPVALPHVLKELAEEVGADVSAPFTCAVTMTAELSQMFRLKREGVNFVLDAVAESFAKADILVLTVAGHLVTVAEARMDPLAVAAANWAATAGLVAQRYADAVLVDVGTTTTDVIPIVHGEVAAEGNTDPERLASGELIYTGAVRTAVEAIVHEVRHRSRTISVSAEAFALIGDVHFWLGDLDARDYTAPTPDGRPVTREFAGERIARIICADVEMITADEITQIARDVALAQVSRIGRTISRVCARHPSIRTVVTTGIGEFIARRAAPDGFEVVRLGDDIGEGAARYAPAAAVALLCANAAAGGPPLPRSDDPAARVRPEVGGDRTSLVIKVGGGLLDDIEHLDKVLRAIADVSPSHALLVIPGGGPFAETVRRVDAQLTLGDSAAHWMAVLAMDQYAHLLASRMERGVVVFDGAGIVAAHAGNQIPILAPSRWLAAADPLPHSWDVTSDSIAAWLASELGASRVMLVKPPGAAGDNLVDRYFARALRPSVVCDCLAAEDAIQLLDQMAGRANAAV